MTAPLGTPPELASYLAQLEDRLSAMETPGSPTPLFPMASANLSAANAATYINAQVFVSDLAVIGYSDGSHWFRSDTGGVIA